MKITPLLDPVIFPLQIFFIPDNIVTFNAAILVFFPDLLPFDSDQFLTLRTIYFFRY